MNSKWILAAWTVLLIASCKTPKDVTYFQGIDSLTTQQLQAMEQSYSTTIQPDDLLTITVTSQDPSVVTPFNPPAFAYAGQGETSIATSQHLQTYLVDLDGYINFPVIGRSKAGGQTKRAFTDSLQQAIRKYVTDATVHVQIVNYKITMLGDFNRPGRLNVPNDRISILEAIGQAGDLTINANRKNILVIRNNNGIPETGRIDLTDPALFDSPFYYLKQNDIVYAEPNNAKKRNANYSSAQQYNVTVFSAILSVVSLITTSAIALSRNKQ